ncbi:hypothetical protein [Comamonas thiooxydans]|uniref:hypothetical protein n=1 Tax=Comamonas thiooxydans TaxID=363952 RepID=UPI000B40AFE3|nr:hypothetical protein [Comamonas thiooxydans]
METIVNWGRLARNEDTIRVTFVEETVCASEQAGAQLAASLMLTLTNGEPCAVPLDFYVSEASPLAKVMSPDKCAFVQVRLNDGKTTADLMGVTCSPEAEALGFQSDHQLREHAIWLKDHKKPGFGAWLSFSKVIAECRKLPEMTYVQRLNFIGQQLGRQSLVHLLPEILHGCFPEETVRVINEQLDSEAKRLLMAELVAEI